MPLVRDLVVHQWRSWSSHSSESSYWNWVAKRRVFGVPSDDVVVYPAEDDSEANACHQRQELDGVEDSKELGQHTCVCCICGGFLSYYLSGGCCTCGFLPSATKVHCGGDNPCVVTSQMLHYDIVE